MEYLQTLLDSNEIPLLTAFILGLLTAASPCPLATNITAIGFIGKSIDNKRRLFMHGILYVIGRTIAYTILGSILIYMLKSGIETFELQLTVGRLGEICMPPAMILIGLVMLAGDRLPLHKIGFSSTGWSEQLSGALGSLMLGVVFALAFCPTSGLFFFGMLIPMSASADAGYALPLVYALATGIPVMIIAWILAFSIGSIGTFYRKVQVIRLWLNRTVAVLFIGVGLYYILA